MTAGIHDESHDLDYACETGLGQVAGGEGVLRLQRTFQVAGARTTITSLWMVPDVATQLWLMREGGRRGISLPDDEIDKPKTPPPFYWAGFVLSGDWR